MNSYSQTQEDTLIAQYFDKPGTLASVGENDGKTLSNSLAFIEMGWSAYLIEPSPSVFPKLELLHKDNIKVQCIQAAITDRNGNFTFHDSGSAERIKGEDRALVSSLDLKETSKWRRAGVRFNKIQVPGITWKTFIERYDVFDLDFISLDAEGFDLKILKQIDFNFHKTKVVCVEWNSISKVSYENVMKPFGFEIKHCNSENLIFVR